MLTMLLLQLNDAKLFRGFGGEVMRKAAICLIERASLSKLPFHNDPVLGWFSISLLLIIKSKSCM